MAGLGPPGAAAVPLSARRAPGGAEWVNWYRNQRCAPRTVAHPRGEGEVRNLMRDAAAATLPVRVAGAGHSNVPLCLTDGVLLDLGAMRGVLGVDRERRRATVLPGTTIADLGPLLWRHGLALANQGDIDSQQIAGAVATATHGTGRELGSLSGALSGARLVLADGDVVEIAGGDGELLRAARTALGALGVMTALTLEVTDAYSLWLRLRTGSWRELLACWDECLSAHRHFAFYWCPTARSAGWLGLEPPVRDDEVIIKTMDRTPADADASANGSSASRIDRGYRIYAETYRPNFHELERIVAIEHARDAVAAVRELIVGTYPEQEFPVEVRFVGADDALLSPFSGRASCAISVSGVMGADNAALFGDCERVLGQFGARAHWGKWHSHGAERLRALYPGYDAFCAARERLDPDGRLLNDYLRGLLAAPGR